MNDPETLRALLDRTPDKIVVVDDDGVCSYANAAVERLLGYQPAELVGEDLFAYVHEDDLADVRAAFDAVVDGDRRTATVEFRFGASDGSWVWVESRVADDGNSAVDGYVISSRDISDRKRAEASRKRAENRLATLTANTQDALWLYTADWDEVVFINDAYEDIWGLSKDALDDNPREFIEGVHPDDRDTVRDAMASISAGEPVDVEFRVNPSRNYQRWAWVQAEPVLDDGEVTHVVGFTRDITDRRRREQQLRVMDHLLRHNLRNDMNVILGQAELAAERGGEDVRSHMEIIAKTGEQLLETADKERDIVSLLTDAPEVRTVELVDLVEDAADDVRAANPEATVDVSAPATAAAKAVPSVDLAFEELFENAIVHAEDDRPYVEVSVQPGEDRVDVRIEDRASPIPTFEYATVLGDRELRDVYHGSGLGLWLVYWLVDLSDGDVTFGTADQGGNAVTVSFPRPAD